MGDAWSTKPGERPIRPDVAAIIREAQNATEHAGDAGLDGGVGLDGATFKHTEVGDDAQARGGSTLGKASLGTAALTAALTLHPCVYISGCGDASREVLHTMLSTVGSCSVSLVLDEESGQPTGEASATFGSAAAAEAAIRTYDGARFDDGVLHVSVAKRAAQGSLTTRGKGKGRGKGGGGITFAERQRDLISSQRLALAEEEKDAFARARAAQQAPAPGGRGGRGSGGGGSQVYGAPTAFDVPLRPPSGPASAAAAASADAAAASKKRKLGGLPGVVVVKPQPKPTEQEAAKPPPPAQAPSAGGGGLLGLAGYGSDDDDDDDDE